MALQAEPVKSLSQDDTEPILSICKRARLILNPNISPQN